MKSLVIPQTKLTDEKIIAAYQDAVAAGISAGIKALICGLMLIEKRASLGGFATMANPQNANKSAINGRNQHSRMGQEKFTDFMVKSDMAKTTAYRFMDTAERIVKSIMGLAPEDDLPAVIDIEGEAVPFSRALLAEPEQLPEKAREFRQNVFDFMEDKTLGEAARAVMNGEDEPHRITRAANGRRTGGHNGEDRKDFPKFTFQKLKHLSTFFSHWKTMSSSHRAEIIGMFQAAMAGEEFKFSRDKKPAKFELWPAELCEVAIETLRVRLRKREEKS